MTVESQARDDARSRFLTSWSARRTAGQFDIKRVKLEKGASKFSVSLLNPIASGM